MEALAFSLPLFTEVRARLVLRSSNPLCRIASPLCGRRMANCPALRLLPVQDVGAMNKDSLRRESLDTVCWHRIVRESQGGGGGSRKVSSRSSNLHTPSKNPRRFQGYKHTSLK